LVIRDILGVVYAPHKTFKKVANNPKYLAVAIIILLIIVLQTGYYYSYYSKINFEQTLPPVGRLNAFTSINATHWITSQGITVKENSHDYINQTFYGNNSLQFTGYEKSLSIALEQFGYTADCGPDGFTSLSMNIKQASSNDPPQTGIVTLYTANGTSDYFTRDITSMLTSNLGSWNNLTIPVGTSDWQATGSPDWAEITGLKLTVTYPTASERDILLQGLFFRGQYLTQTNALGIGMFFSVAVYSIFIQTAFQWIILAVISYLLLKLLKANSSISWKPLIVAIGYTLITVVIISTFLALSTFTLPIVHSPYDLPFSTLTYSDAIINSASPASQVAYEAITATTTTFARITSVINVFSYVLQGIFVAFAVKAVSGCTYTINNAQHETTIIETVNEQNTLELSFIKCIIIAIITVVSTNLVLAILAGLGVF